MRQAGGLCFAVQIDPLGAFECGFLQCGANQVNLAAGLRRTKGVADAQADRGNGHAFAIELEMAMADQLTGSGNGRRESSPENHVVQTAFQQFDEFVAGCAAVFLGVGDDTNTFNLDGYTLVDLGADYRFKGLAESPMTLSVGIKNLLDKEHYLNASATGSVVPGSPRSVFVRLKADF